MKASLRPSIAAIAGARELSIAGIKDAQIEAMVATYLDREVNPDNGQMTATTKIDKKKYSVDVSLRQDWTPFFAHLIDAVPLAFAAHFGVHPGPPLRTRSRITQ